MGFTGMANTSLANVCSIPQSSQRHGRRQGLGPEPGRSGARGLSSRLLGLLHGQLGGRIGFEASIGDGEAAADRQTEGSLPDATLGPIDGIQASAQTRRDGVVALLGRLAFRWITEIA